MGVALHNGVADAAPPEVAASETESRVRPLVASL